MKNSYDVIIIGGGPAGSTAATYLARAGFDVLVLEKENFPRFHVGESLLPFCYEIFKDLGVLEQMERDFPRKPGVTFSNEDNSHFSHWCFGHHIKDESQLSFHVERSRFDDMLLKNAAKAGAEVREAVKVLSSHFDAETKQVSVKTQDNAHYKAGFLIDASGQDCFLGKANKTKQSNTSLSPRVAVSGQWQNADLDSTLTRGGLRIIQLEGDKKGWIWMIPVAQNKLSVGVVTELSYYKERKKALADKKGKWLSAYYQQELSTPLLGRQILSNAEIISPLAVNSDYSYANTDKYGSHYAVIGDASAFLDPMFASGVYLSMKSAALVADALIRTIRRDEQAAMGVAYDSIEGAYALIEKMISTYYNPGAIKFSEAQQTLSYANQHDIYSIMHLILAGDFFANHEKYAKTLTMLNSKKKIDGFLNLLGQPQNQGEVLCG